MSEPEISQAHEGPTPEVAGGDNPAVASSTSETPEAVVTESVSVEPVAALEAVPEATPAETVVAVAEPVAESAPESEVAPTEPVAAAGAVAQAARPRPRIGDTRPAPAVPVEAEAAVVAAVTAVGNGNGSPVRERNGQSEGSGSGRGGRGQGGGRGGQRARTDSGSGSGSSPTPEVADEAADGSDDDGADGDEGGSGAGKKSRSRRRSGRERNKGKQVGRYMVCVHVQPGMTQIAMLEGRSLVEHYVSRAADDTNQIDGNVYRGRVQNVLPGMEAAFVDIGIPKNAVLYRGDVRYDREDIEGGAGGGGGGAQPRIEDVLKAGQTILCQVTKNPIGAKGARLTQEVSLPGRFAVLVPNSSAFGISKRLGDNERRRLRRIIDEVKPPGHGMIVRTAAEGVSADELQRDIESLLEQWKEIEAKASKSDAPGLLYREPELSVRILREELNSEYRGVVIDDLALFEQVRDYVRAVSPELSDRVEYYDAAVEGLPIFERYHVHEQLHKALDRKVWLPSGGSLIIERTEALTVIDVNTGKNVGKTNLEETVYRNNLEAAEEVARQLRLRDIGGIIVIDFIDMEIRENRDKVAASLRNALARDKTRTQVFDISELGLVEMTRKRISEGLLETLSTECAVCGGRGVTLDDSALR
jgi:ribonuclease E